MVIKQRQTTEDDSHSIGNLLMLHGHLCSKNIHQLFVIKLLTWLHFVVKSDVAACYMALVTVMPSELESYSDGY